MKAALWYKSGDIRIEDIPEPSPCAGEVKIKVKWCGICGSDLHEFTMGPIFIPVENPHYYRQLGYIPKLLKCCYYDTEVDF